MKMHINLKKVEIIQFLTERRIYTEAQANGDVKLFVCNLHVHGMLKSTATSLADKIAENSLQMVKATAVGDVF